MIIFSIQPSSDEIIETDDLYYPLYRRTDSEHWDVLMTEGWKALPKSAVLRMEEGYQEHKNGQVKRRVRDKDIRKCSEFR